MSSQEIKVEKISKDILVDAPISTPKKHKKSDTASFMDFMNDQLNFGNYTTTKSTSEEDSKVLEGKVQALQEIVGSHSTEVISNQTTRATEIIQTDEIKADKKFADDYLKIDASKLSSDDINNVSMLLANNGIVLNMNQLNGFVNNMVTANQSNLSYTSMNFSKNLYEALNKGYKNNTPVRIDFENSSSVILKIDKEGKLSAQFLASEKGMENLLKENLYLLRAKFDKEGIPYKELVYKEKQDNQNNKSNEE